MARPSLPEETVWVTVDPLGFVIVKVTLAPATEAPAADIIDETVAV